MTSDNHHRNGHSASAPAQRKVLLVAYHFPPQAGSSGHLRSLKYCRYLPKCGWLPTVLTVHPRAYERVDSSQLLEIPLAVRVRRAFALDAQRHLSLRGRYFRYAALPDRWVTWCLGALPAGILEVYRNKIDLILTTFPIPTAVLIGYLLHRLTGVPWVADFRDSMTEDDYPPDPGQRRILRWLERKAVRHASRLVFTAASARRMYLQRYPELSPNNCLLICNGYDEEDFKEWPESNGRNGGGPVRLKHSGLIYPQERDPIPFFRALSRLKNDHKIDPSSLLVELRASGHEGYFRRIVGQLGIDDIVCFAPPLPYREGLRDLNQANLLLLLQGASCDHQIPAKVYEYLRLGKPILALTTQTGDTAGLLRECGGATIVDIADEEGIYENLPAVLESVRTGNHALPQPEIFARYNREQQASELADCLSAVVGEKGQGPPSLLKRARAGR